jgi:hypothetical protein
MAKKRSGADRGADERRRRAREADAKLPAGLEPSGRAEELEHGADTEPSGARGDHRQSVPGTMIPGAPQPAAASGESERIREASESRRRGRK